MSGVNRLLKQHGLRRASYSVLSVVVCNPGMRQADIADTLAIERPNLVQVVDDLEKAGWITRNRPENDRRAYEVHPTSTGQCHYAKVRDALSQFDAKLTEMMDDAARNVLIEGLNTVEAAGAGPDVKEGKYDLSTS